MPNGHSQSSPERGTENPSLRKLCKFARNAAGSGAFTTEEERLHFESQSVVQWAGEARWLLDAAEFKKLTAHLKYFEGGQEHLHVMFQSDEGRMLKVTRPPHFGARSFLLEYANNLLWSNFLFEDDFQFEGVLVHELGVSLVISQPFIKGSSPTREQIAQWFIEQGYEPNGYLSWRHPALDIDIRDAHEGNFILMEDGLLVPIDLQVLRPGREYVADG